VPVEIPKVGLVMETARVTRWLKGVNDTIALGEPLLEVETEKSIVEIEATVSGRLVEILAEPEQEVTVGAAIAWVEDGRPDAAISSAPAPAARTVPVTPEPAAPAARQAQGARASPAARRLAAERGVDLSRIQGSGPGGRIQLEDVEQAASAPQELRVSLSPMRRAVARTMALSNATVPQFQVGRTVDWTRVQERRASLDPQLRAQGLRASVNDFLVHAVAQALMAFPGMNAVFVGSPDSPDAHIRPASGTHIGLVVAMPDGMLVPVIHAAERLSLEELVRQRTDLVERARAGRLRQEEAGGATFTISNLGAAGPDRFTAVLNPPESGILAVGRSREVPVALDGAVVVRPVSDLTLTVDHRLVDGKLAAEFMAKLAELLEGTRTAE
jgi:pyruvate dehydrogenase E2 component (dihydrolipoamide acetyltransferase)